MEKTPATPEPPAGVDPPNDFPAYQSTRLRHPREPYVRALESPLEHLGALCGLPRAEEAARDARLGPQADLTRQHPGEPLGERIVVAGRVLAESGAPLPRTLVEVWQANAAGRYAHEADRHEAPLDPSFSGVGRAWTDAEGCYRFVTIRPGAYPWKNHANAWRPAHIHFSVFGPRFGARLVTQMYFPGDPLLALDPIFQSVPDPQARERLVSRFDLDLTEPEWALGYRFDIVLRGKDATPLEAPR